MVSERKRLANRRNAQKSTGPRTAAGKARSSRNAIFHGLFAVDDVLPGEDEKTFRLLRDQLILSLLPRDAMEYCLVERIASATWRLRRLQSTQRHAYEKRVGQMFHRLCDTYNGEEDQLAEYVQERRGEAEQLPASAVMLKLLDNDDRTLDRLMLYEQRLEQSLHRSLRQLQALQKRRRQKPGPFLAAVHEMSALVEQAQARIEPPAKEQVMDQLLDAEAEVDEQAPEPESAPEREPAPEPESEPESCEQAPRAGGDEPTAGTWSNPDQPSTAPVVTDGPAQEDNSKNNQNEPTAGWYVHPWKQRRARSSRRY